jgi:hypothetical protein
VKRVPLPDSEIPKEILSTPLGIGAVEAVTVVHELAAGKFFTFVQYDQPVESCLKTVSELFADVDL